MAKAQSGGTGRNIYQDGPHLQSALLCERVLVEQDGVKSAIRIVDRFTRTAVVKGGVEENIPPLRRNLFLLLMFKRGEAGGKHRLRLELENPRAEVREAFDQTMVFEGGAERGCDFIVNLQIEFPTDGVYWINIYVDEVRVTRIPMTVVFIVTRQGSSPRPPGQPVS